MKLSGAIFDMDGTLLDSMWIFENYATRYILSRGLTPRPDLEEAVAKLTLAESAVYLAKTYALEGGPARVARELAEAGDALYEEVQPKAGVMEMLETFRAAGIPMALATMTARPTLERVLSRLGILPYLSYVFTCDDVGALKSSPAIYRAALEALGTKKEETAVFEDAIYAIRTASRDGFPVVAVYDEAFASRFDEASALSFLAVRDYRKVDFSPYLR